MTRHTVQLDSHVLGNIRLNKQHPNRLRLLFLAHDFPPLASPASVREGYMAKYLARLGWDVTIVTPHPSLWIRTDNPEKVELMLQQEGIHRITTGMRWRFLNAGNVRCWNRGLGWLIGGLCRKITRMMHIEAQIGWLPELESACRSLCSGDIDIILATGSPFIAFRAAHRLSQRLDVPFVLDYRDLWSGWPYRAVPHPRRIVAEEQLLLRECAAAIGVSSSLALSLRTQFPIVKAVHVVSNGYDPEDLSNIQPHYFGHFAIVYAGNFYPPKHVITPIMKAMQKIASSRDIRLPEWRFHYMGASPAHIIAEAERCGVRDLVVLHGQVSRDEARSAVAGAGVSVAITSIQEEGSLEDRGILTSKVFEALGLGTRVLLIAPVGSDAEAIVEGTACGRRFSGNQIDEIAKYLRDVMTGQVPKPVPPNEYSWPKIALPLNSLLRRIVDESRRKALGRKR